jgi:hypothetical protein
VVGEPSGCFAASAPKSSVLKGLKLRRLDLMKDESKHEAQIKPWIFLRRPLQKRGASLSK